MKRMITFFTIAVAMVCSLQAAQVGEDAAREVADMFFAAEAPAKSQYCAIWMLDLAASQPALFRIAMTGGSTAATYVDDISLYYTGQTGDVNGDNVVNIADVNAAINMILNGTHDADGDVNGDGTVNIADVNAIIALILS